ncbi:MAG: tRNA lysidine(34) synthetase TilS [Bacilli bacterium]|nr:tRNA lysidine(34) synthetase TilS [Bacilli bacterium]
MDKAYNFLVKEVGLKYGDTVVVGVSGGPDSMALLHLMSHIKKETDIFIICAHVNHNVRAESNSEKEFIEKYCDNNQIAFESMKIEDYGDDNFHNEARTKRYHYFGKVVRKYGASFLLTAHHADDLIETILMRIARGSTLRGYSGFSRIVNMGEYLILRPFIDITKDEILEYNKKNNITYVQDASNKQNKYTRNRYRKYVLPFFKKEDPNVHEKFLKFSNTLLEYNNFIENQMRKVINDVYRQNILNIEKFLSYDKLIRMKIIYYILENVYHDDLMLIYDSHAELIHHLITSERPNATIHLPNNVKVIKSYESLMFVKESMEQHEYEIEIIDYVNLPNGMNIKVDKEEQGTGNDVCRLNSQEITMPLHVRTRKIGDRIEVKGLLGTKKIKDIFINEKIPTRDRDVWPIVVDSSERIVWLPGLKKSKFDKEKNEKHDIILKYY